MRSFVVRHAQAIALLSMMPDGDVTGKNAASLTQEQALRIGRKMDRWAWSGRSLSLPQLIHKSRQKRRARQTHPGKR